ncbi:hypothetical protein BDU57DRAFT_515516 [Ampelomyces quisqualis]|uniref:ABM domain-containing protein n=1 Tax=Ampelomyces quisqualis TaxID=50730 RepID=A0A6A5QK83_AMPQU|nr:hypothetical protein BDU57DRAFT_515516 [Ampelomyces quisqualis]
MVYTIVVHLYAKPSREAISKLHAKLAEASRVYSQDRETLSWFVMQDVHDDRAFTIVERYVREEVCSLSLSLLPPLSSFSLCPFSQLPCFLRLVFFPHPVLFLRRQFSTLEIGRADAWCVSSQSQEFHLGNPYWKTFDPFVEPLLERPMDLRRFVELETGGEERGLWGGGVGTTAGSMDRGAV